MTLKRLRALAPEEDLNSEALALPPRQPWRHEASVTKPKARTLAALEYFCGERGRLAVQNATWGAIYQWLRAAGHGHDVVSIAALLAGTAARKMKGWTSELAKMDRSELKRMGTLAAECRAAWLRVGQPFLLENIRNAQRYSNQCERIERERAAGRYPEYLH